MSVRILALDTATEACSVALLDGDQVFTLFEPCAREHTQRILPMIQQILAESGLKLNQMDALAFGRGPGSFTGIRIGIGVAQGLALGSDLPVTGISTLKTLAQGVWREEQAERVLVAIDARMGEVYWAEYQRDSKGNWHGEASESLLTPEAAVSRMALLEGCWTPAGTGWQTWPMLFKASTLTLGLHNVLLPSAADMLPLAVVALAVGEGVAADCAEPVYLRNQIAWKKLPDRK